MANIYTTPNWLSNNAYNTHDFVTYTDGFIYYAIRSIAAGISTFLRVSIGATSSTGQNWDGMTIINGVYKPIFIWRPSYQSNYSHTPKIKEISFGDGYTQRIQDGINNNLLSLEISFENRTIDEISAILHFLNARNGTESFIFTPREPFNSVKRFICKEWNDTDSFFGNYSLRAKFIEIII